ncbi:MAG TPA: alpha/beta hydrolase-fold protein [Candidatus Acidoferrum sp.]|jgi:predicted peptidase
MRRKNVRWLPLLTYFALLALYILSATPARAVEVTKDDVDFRKIVYVSKDGARLPYRLYVPHSYSNQQKYPLVLWLHGGTGRGSDNLKQLDRQNQLGTHFWIAPDVQEKFPAFVLVPQCPSGEVWADPEFNQPSKALLLTIEILAKVQKDYSIDADRIYLAGQSMGGSGVWSLLQNYPEKWAGALVLSAYDTFTAPEAIAQIPLWVFQGDEDMSVPVDMVRDMMKQLKKVHANLRYTEYHKMDHEVWTKAFAEPDLLPWLSSQKRNQAAQGQLGSGAAPPSH